MMYDICIIGAGMVGSAAARWTTQQNGMKVCLIGPQEPTDEEWTSERREIFACHYDEGRITRELDEDHVWALLAQRSIQRYRQIEQQSGIQFFHEVGYLTIGELTDLSGRSTKENAINMGVDMHILNHKDVHSMFPYLHVEEHLEYIWTPKRAGHISPRKLVTAQQRIAETQGCNIIAEVVVKVTEERCSNGDMYVKILSETGREIRSRRALLCTGAFTNFYQLLPPDTQIDMYHPQTFVVKVELTEEDARRMANMPSLYYHVSTKESYILPPIKYPDGKYYLKIGWIGVGLHLTNLQDIAKWFRGQGEKQDTSHLVNMLSSIVAGLKPVSLVPACCVISQTPTDHLFCDMITPRLGALVGMTGRGAKSSDEIGRMGALMIVKGEWDHDLPTELFKIQYKRTPNQKCKL